MFKKILVPIDISHSDSGEAGLRAGAGIAGKTGASLILLHVTPDLPNLVSSQLPADYAKKTRESAARALEALASKAGLKSGGYEVQTAHGQVYHEILKTAGKTATDLIVVASHRPGVADYLLGSTAAKVVRHAECSVLVVRGQ